LSDIRAKAIQHPSGCILIQHLKPTSNGYYRITIAKTSDTSNSKRVLVHHLVMACGHGGVFPSNSYGEDDWDDVSHLCNNKGCLKPDHLFIERHSINLTRLCCARFLNRHA